MDAMRAVVQRVRRAQVQVQDRVVGRIGSGLLVFIGIAAKDTPEDAKTLAEKIARLRIFDDDAGKMNRSLVEIDAGVLCVSQFTLYGDCRKGRRPSYDRAARPGMARPLYENFVQFVRQALSDTSTAGSRVQTGEFQAMMQVELVNDGPVTLLLDSEKLL
jgi:D-aminoacyl-tRNA deacylase